MLSDFEQDSGKQGFAFTAWHLEIKGNFIIDFYFIFLSGKW